MVGFPAKRAARTPSQLAGCGGGRGGSAASEAMRQEGGDDDGTPAGTSTEPSITIITSGEGAGGTSTPDALREVLLRERLFLLSPAKQRDVATRLSRAGVSARGLEDVVLYTRQRADDAAQADRILGKVLSDPETVPVIVQSLEGWREDYEAQRQQQAEAEASGRSALLERNWMDYRDAPQEGESREEWAWDRLCRIAWCRVQADGKSVAVVADELGVEEAKVAEMLERGRVLQGGHQVRKVVKDSKGETQKERIERFRREMRERRAEQ